MQSPCQNSDRIQIISAIKLFALFSEYYAEIKNAVGPAVTTRWRLERWLKFKNINRFGPDFKNPLFYLNLFAYR
jgi:hypothetical protein